MQNSARVHINLKSFPKHKITLFENESNVGNMEVDDGRLVVNEFINTQNVFEDIKIKRMVSKALELFEPEQINIVEKK